MSRPGDPSIGRHRRRARRRPSPFRRELLERRGRRRRGRRRRSVGSGSNRRRVHGGWRPPEELGVLVITHRGRPRQEGEADARRAQRAHVSSVHARHHLLPALTRDQRQRVDRRLIHRVYPAPSAGVHPRAGPEAGRRAVSVFAEIVPEDLVVRPRPPGDDAAHGVVRRLADPTHAADAAATSFRASAPAGASVPRG